MSDAINMDGCRTFIAANNVLNLFARGTSIERRKGGWYVCWPRMHGVGFDIVEKRWQCRGGQGFYPVWHKAWGHGGTCCTALSQLIRWCQVKPVLPLSTWRYWCGPKVALGRDRGSEIVATLFKAGYPEVADCVLCGKEITGGLDWWNLNGVSGPCCGWTTGCRQKGGE